MADRIRINERIRAREVRVVDEEGGQLGVMQPFEAMRLARERGLDLVEISPTADPPVCKITDHAQLELGPRMEANILMALLAPKKGASAKPAA